MPIHSPVSLLRSPTISMMLFYKTVTSSPETRLNSQSFIQVRPHSSAGTSDNTFIPDFDWLITVAVPSLLSTVFTVFRLKFICVQHHELVCVPTMLSSLERILQQTALPQTSSELQDSRQGDIQHQHRLKREEN